MTAIDQLLDQLRQRDVFLWLEGDRLRYRAAKNALTPDLLAQLKAHKAEVITFLRQARATSQLPPIEHVDRSSFLALSFSQQRLWWLHQFEPDSTSNNMPVVLKFTGTLDIQRLEQSLQAVVRRQEVLRTRFPAVNGQPTLVIEDEVSLILPIIDLRDIPEHQRDAKVLHLTTQEARQPFDLANGPILRMKLFRLRDDEHLLIWNMHCIICDGASSDLFYQDLTEFYKSLVMGIPPSLSEISIQYVDFSHWQRQWLQGEVLDSQLRYWKQTLKGSLPTLQLPFDHPRPTGVQTYRGDRGPRMLPIDLNASLSQLSQQLGGTLFMTLLSAFKVLLYRYCNQDDLLLSFASAGRGQVETEPIIGFFSNTLLLRTHFQGNPTFRELFNRVKDAALQAYAHQDIPFEKLIEELRPEQRQGRSPIFQVKFALNPPWSKGRGMASMHLPNLTITSLFGYIYHGKTKYDLTLVMREQDEGLGMVFDYNAELFDASTIARMIDHFHSLLEEIVANPDQQISDFLPLLTKTDTVEDPSGDVSTTLVETQTILVKPQDDLEQTLVNIWESILGIQPIGIQDNFFDLGGYSLLAVRLFGEIEQRLGKVLPLSVLVKAPTVEKIAQAIRQKSEITSWSPLVEIQAGNGQLWPLFCMHGGGFNILIYRDLANNLGPDYPVYGLQAQGLQEGETVADRMEELAANYIKEIQQVQPHGPYYLSGLSNGGNIALEMAQQLQEQGEQVALLAMFDTYGPNGIQYLSSIPRFASSFKYFVEQSIPRFAVKKLDEIKGTSLLETLLSNQASGSSQASLETSKPQPIEAKTVSLSLISIKGWMDRFSQYILDRSPWAFLSPSTQLSTIDNSLSDRLKELEEKYKKVHVSYTPQPYNGKITLFRAQECPPGYRRKHAMGWAAIASQGVDVHIIPGHHTSLMTSPLLAKKVKDHIDRLQVEYRQGITNRSNQ